jgi:kinetochore protein Nuf2
MEDFSPRDIRDPSPGRVRRILSAMINFYLFEREYLTILEPLEAALEEANQAEQDAERANAERRAAIEKRT